MAKLILENMEFYAFHGHYAEERQIGGRYRVDVEIETDIARATETDILDDAVDYSRVYAIVKHEMAVVSRLMEHLAGRIAKAVKDQLGITGTVTVSVSKLNPPVGGKMDAFTIRLTL